MEEVEDGNTQAPNEQLLDDIDDHSHDDNEEDAGTPERPPPILIPGTTPLRRCRSSGSSCSSSSSPSATPATSRSRCPSSSMVNDLRNDRELITMACSSTKSPEDVDALDLSSVAKKTRKALKSLRALAEFTNLVTLNASNNAIGSVDGVEVFLQLEALSLSRNHLKRLGSPLFTLTTLRHLDLSGNFISHIPKAIVSLEQLETLNLSGNNLSVLKEVDLLGTLANLYECSFTANPFCKLPTYKDYLVCKLPSLEKLDESVITALIRDKSRRRFSEEMFSKDSRLREAGIAHEHEQNKLREARSALEAENMRLKGELQVKSKLLQNKSKEWSSATGQLLQLQQEIAMLNLDQRGSVVSPPRGPSSSLSVGFSVTSPQYQVGGSRHSVKSATPSAAASTSARLSESFARATSGSRRYDDENEEDGDLDFHLHQPTRSVSPVKRSAAAVANTSNAAVSPLHPNLRYAPPPPLRSLSLLDQFDEEVARSAAPSPTAKHETQNSRHHTQHQDDYSREDHSSYSKRLVDSVCSPLRTSSYSPQYAASERPTSRQSEVELSEPAASPSHPTPIAVSPQPERSKSFDHVRRAFSELSPQCGQHSSSASAAASMDHEEVNLAEDDAIKHDMSINRSIRFPTFEDDLACPAYEDEAHTNSSRATRTSQSQQQHQRERDLVDQLTPPPSYTHRHNLAPSSPQRLLSSPSPSPRSKAQRLWKRQHDEFREQTFGNPSKSPLKIFIPTTTAAASALSAPLSFIDRDMLMRQIQALQSCKQSLVGEIAREEQLLHALKQEANAYASQMDQLHLGIQVCLGQDANHADAAGNTNSGINTAASPRRKQSQQQREEENYRAKLEFCRSKLRFAEDKEKEIEMTMVRTTKRVLESDLQNTPFDKEIFALTHKLQQAIVQKEEIHQEMSRLMRQQQQQQHLSSSTDNDEAGHECASPYGARRRSSGGGYNSSSHHQRQQTVDDMLEEEEQRQRLSAEHQQSVALARKRLDELQRRHNDVLDRIRVKEERIASFVDELKDVEKELLLISQRIPAVTANSPHPLRRQRSVSLDFYPMSSSSVMPSPSQTTMDAVELELAEALRNIKDPQLEAERDAGASLSTSSSGVQQQYSSLKPSGDQFDCTSQDPSCSDAASSTGEARPPCSGSVGSLTGQESLKSTYELRFKELLTVEMLEEIKKDIYERLSTQLTAAASMNTGEKSERAVAHDQKDLHAAIAAALETQMKLAIESFHKQRDDDVLQQKNIQEKSKAVTSTPSPSRRTRTGRDQSSVSTATRPLRHEQLTPANDTPKDDDIACDQLEDFVPVDATYARKYRFVKYRSSQLPPSPTGGDGGKSKSTTSTRASGVQRILKACERLEQAENDCKIDSVSAIEVDPMGNKRSSLKVLLMGARDLPTSHLRTKNLDPYVSLEIVYPEHIVSGKQPRSSLRLGSGYADADELGPSSSSKLHHHHQSSSQSFRSRTKKKSVYPVWDEDFEFAPVVSLKGYLHVRILNDRKLSREQLVGEVRIPLRTLLHQKKTVEWFPLRIAVPQPSYQTLSGDMATMRKTSTILRTSGGTIRLQLQLTYSRLEKYKCAVDELVTKFFHEHNQLPPFIEAAGGSYGVIKPERQRKQKNAHNQEQHNELEEEESQDDDDNSGDAMRRRRYATREDAAALKELQYQQQQQQQYNGVPEVESPSKDGESAMLTFDSWRAERGSAAEAIRLRDDDSSWGELSPQQTSMDVMIASHIFDNGPLPGTSETVAPIRRLSAESSRRLWESVVVPLGTFHERNSYMASTTVTGQPSAEHAYFYPEPAQPSSATERAGTARSTLVGSYSVVRHPSLANPATASRSAMPPPAITTSTVRGAPSTGSNLPSRTPRAGNRHNQSYAAHHPTGRRKTTGASQRPECFDDYSPYHPDFKSTDVMDMGNNDHFAKRRKGPSLYAWQAPSASSSSRGGGLAAGLAARDDEMMSRKTDLRIFKSPGFARRQPTSGFPERYIGLDNQTCERLKRMFGRMDGGGGTAPG